MAQTTRSTTRRRRTSTSKSTGGKRSNSSSRGNSRARSSSTRSSRSRPRTASRPRTTTSNGPIGKTGEKVAELASKAKPDATTVRRTGQRVSNIASKAKTPLVAGGAALAGLAGGVALKNRTETKRPAKRFRAVQLPKSLKNIDLNQLIEAGRRVRAIGEQVGDVADTADKTHKKHK